MEKRIVPLKNYIILTVIIAITILLSFLLIKHYQKTLKESLEKTKLHEVLYNVNVSDLNNFLIDNPNIIIYIHKSNDKTYEDEFYEYVVQNQLKNDIVMLDLTNNQKVNANTLKNITINKVIFEYNNLILISEGKVVDVLYENEDKIELLDVKNFIEKHEVLND